MVGDCDRDTGGGRLWRFGGQRIVSSMRMVACAVAAWSVVGAGCKFPYPGDVPDDDATPNYALGGSVSGLWAGGAITLHVVAGDVTEDVAAVATEPFTFATRILHDTSYLVTVADDGPDHDCVVTNGSGRVVDADITDLAVTCTNLIPHGVTISTAVPFTFDPRVTRYSLPVSILQQELTIVVTGPTLTSATVAGQTVTIGLASPAVPLGQGQTTVSIDVSKGPLSRRYELVFDRGAAPIVEALYGRAANAEANDYFGYAVAASGAYVAVGAPLEDSSSQVANDNAVTNSGAVYIFRRSGPSWLQTQRLKGSAVTPQRWFGNALAMSSDVLVVGAPNDEARGSSAGAVQVFHLDSASGQWLEQQRLTAADPHPFDYFGAAVAIGGDRILVGAPGHDAGNADPNKQFGLVYVFRESGTTWSEETRVRPPNPQPLDGFGRLLAADADTIAVGYAGDRVGMHRRSGTLWSSETVVTGGGLYFAIAGDTLALGHPDDASGTGQPGDQSAPRAGAVRVYSRTGVTWSESAYLKAAAPQAEARVGTGVAIRGNVIVTAAARLGQIQPFHKVGGTWVVVPPLIGTNSPSADFGDALGLTGTSAIVAAFGDGGPGGALPASGTAWFFR